MDREPTGTDPVGRVGTIACVLITHLRAKLEMRSQPQLREHPVVIIDRSQGRVLVTDHFPAAHGVTPGMTPEQALSRQVGGSVLEADEPHYRRVFQRVLESLQGVSDRVEEAELGTAYVGLDGLEVLYGGEARLVNTLLNAVPLDLRPPGRGGPRQVPRLRRRHCQRTHGGNEGAHGRRRFPVSPDGGLAAHPRGDQDGAAPLRATHPGRRGGHDG